LDFDVFFLGTAMGVHLQAYGVARGPAVGDTAEAA
jgi:hypothetical protein